MKLGAVAALVGCVVSVVPDDGGCSGRTLHWIVMEPVAQGLASGLLLAVGGAWATGWWLLYL